MDSDEKEVARLFDDAMERAWEEAKLRDLMTLYHMWREKEFPQFKTFDDLFDKFFRHDDVVRNMKEKEFFSIEHVVVDVICKSSSDLARGLCTGGEEKG
jgi:hypothetical protein